MKKLFYFLSIIMLLFSCSKQDRDLVIINQEASIDKYIASKYPDNPLVRKGGSNRIIIDGINATDSLEYGDSLYFYYSGFVFSNGPSSLFTTNLQTVAEKNSLILSDPDYEVEKVLFEENIYTIGLTNGLLGMREGEHSIIVFSAKYGFNNTIVYNIPKLSSLIYEIWVEKIIKQ